MARVEAEAILLFTRVHGRGPFGHRVVPELLVVAFGVFVATGFS